MGEECVAVRIVEGFEGTGKGERVPVLGLGADFTDAKQMVGLRERLERGTSYVCPTLSILSSTRNLLPDFLTYVLNVG